MNTATIKDVKAFFNRSPILNLTQNITGKNLGIRQWVKIKKDRVEFEISDLVFLDNAVYDIDKDILTITLNGNIIAKYQTIPAKQYTIVVKNNFNTVLKSHKQWFSSDDELNNFVKELTEYANTYMFRDNPKVEFYLT